MGKKKKGYAEQGGGGDIGGGWDDAQCSAAAGPGRVGRNIVKGGEKERAGAAVWDHRKEGEVWGRRRGS